MKTIWSHRYKFNKWRQIWLALAESQHELGLSVTREQITELQLVVNRVNPDGSIGITDDEIRIAEKYEKEFRHDVMSHVHALGDVCPGAKGIIHLGMTGQDVVCNSDAMIVTDAINLLESKLRVVTPLPEMKLCIQRLLSHTVVRWRGLRGATGTQASFLNQCNNDHSLVVLLESNFLRKLTALGNYRTLDVYLITGQTSPRIVDAFVLSDLAAMAAVLVNYLGPDPKSLSIQRKLKQVINLVGNAYTTASVQWLERSLDDSSNRRICMPEAFIKLYESLDYILSTSIK